MITLGIHTAFPGCDVALLRGRDHIAHRGESSPRGQDARLPGLVQEALADAGLASRDIDRIAVVTGPGSFTGIRVGVAFARGLALALGRPCLGVTSLEATIPTDQTGSALVLLPAQRRAPDITYWVQGFRNDAPTGPPEERRLEDLVAHLRAHPHNLFGDAEALTKAAPDLVASPALPSAEAAARYSLGRDPDALAPDPVYARAPDATPRPGMTR
jgi:tRNA threonylcarbamoyladenosine biosynthesis protein TsaB